MLRLIGGNAEVAKTRRREPTIAASRRWYLRCFRTGYIVRSWMAVAVVLSWC